MAGREAASDSVWRAFSVADEGSVPRGGEGFALSPRGSSAPLAPDSRL